MSGAYHVFCQATTINNEFMSGIMSESRMHFVLETERSLIGSPPNHETINMNKILR